MKGVRNAFFSIGYFIAIVIFLCFSACTGSDNRMVQGKGESIFKFQVYFQQSQITICGGMALNQEQTKEMIEVTKVLYGKYDPKGQYIFMIDAADLEGFRSFNDFTSALRKKGINAIEEERENAKKKKAVSQIL